MIAVTIGHALAVAIITNVMGAKLAGIISSV